MTRIGDSGSGRDTRVEDVPEVGVENVPPADLAVNGDLFVDGLRRAVGVFEQTRSDRVIRESLSDYPWTELIRAGFKQNTRDQDVQCDRPYGSAGSTKTHSKSQFKSRKTACHCDSSLSLSSRITHARLPSDRA